MPVLHPWIKCAVYCSFCGCRCTVHEHPSWVQTHGALLSSRLQTHSAAPSLGANEGCCSLRRCRLTVRCSLSGCPRAAPSRTCECPQLRSPPARAPLGAQRAAERGRGGASGRGAERSVPGPRHRPRGAAIGSGAGPGPGEAAAAAVRPRALSAAALPRHVAEESGTEQRRRLRALRRAASLRRRRPAEPRARSGAAPQRRRYARATLAEQQRRVLRPRLQGARGCGKGTARGGAGRAGPEQSVGCPGTWGGGGVRGTVPCHYEPNRAVQFRAEPCHSTPCRAQQPSPRPPAKFLRDEVAVGHLPSCPHPLALRAVAARFPLPSPSPHLQGSAPPPDPGPWVQWL